MSRIDIYVHDHRQDSNLPSWPGALVVYSRAAKIVEWLNSKHYASQKAAAKGKSFRYSPPYDVEIITKAMNSGDEEILKSMNAQFSHVWQ